MDPDKVLNMIRELAVNILNNAKEDVAYDSAELLATYIEELDMWLTMGGFKPKAWERTNS